MFLKWKIVHMYFALRIVVIMDIEGRENVRFLQYSYAEYIV